VFKYYFSNTWIDLGCSGVSLCSLGVETKVSPYSRQDGLSEDRSQIGGLKEIKREKRLSSMSQKVGWVPSRLLDRDSFSPKYKRCDHSLQRFFSITSFDEGFSDIEMALFDRTIGTRVVRWDADMVYMVLLREVLNCLDKCRAIICDYPFNCSPTT